MIIRPSIFPDSRGFFFESYRESQFRDAGVPAHFVQENISKSHAGVVRGLHFQRKPHEQGKLVRCLSGAIYDVVVDIRPQSPTFKHWFGLELSDAEHVALYVPPGFAHGFQALRESTVLYKCTRYYAKESEGGICYSDPELKILWPVPVSAVSEKDATLPTLREFMSSDLRIS